MERMSSLEVPTFRLKYSLCISLRVKCFSQLFFSSKRYSIKKRKKVYLLFLRNVKKKWEIQLLKKNTKHIRNLK